jgi:hypothetical protein
VSEPLPVNARDFGHENVAKAVDKELMQGALLLL